MIRKQKDKLLNGLEDGVFIDTKKAALYIYGAIGLENGVYVTDIQSGVNMIPEKEIYLHISSPGGDAFEGIAIYNFLKQSGKSITVYIEELVASSASIIAMAGNTIEMNDDSQLMIHNAASCGYGDADYMEIRAAALRSVNQSIKETYLRRFTGSEEELTSFMDAETYFTVAEAIKWGLADRLHQNNIGNFGSMFENSSLQINSKKRTQARMLSRFQAYINTLNNILGGK